MSSAPASARQRAPARRWSAAKRAAAMTEQTSPSKDSWLGRTRSPTMTRATGSATRATSPLYRPSTGHRLPAERRLDGLAHAREGLGRLDLLALAIRDVEGVERMIQIGGDLGRGDI